MNKDIKNILENYRNITEAIIINVQNDIDTENLIKKREALIKTLVEDKSFNKEEVKKNFKDNSLIELDKRLQSLIEEKLQETKQDIKVLNDRKNANNAYNKSRNLNNFFERKI